MQSLSYAIPAILISVVGFGQTIPMKQRINGRVVDADSKSSISNVHVIVRNKIELSTTTDSLGYFKLELPVGRHDLEFRMLGFTTQLVADLPVTSAKEVELLRQFLLQHAKDVRELHTGHSISSWRLRTALTRSSLATATGGIGKLLLRSHCTVDPGSYRRQQHIASPRA